MKKLFTLMLIAIFGFATLTTTSFAQTKPVTTHLKKDGTPDKRFKENKAPKVPLKKDGTPDKRFKVNKTVTPAKKKK